MSSARAIMAAMEELKGGPYEHRLMDITLKIKTIFTFFTYAYAAMNEHFPLMWKVIYDGYNDPRATKRWYDVFYPLFYASKMNRILDEEKPDVVVSLVPHVNPLLVRAIKDAGRNIPLITVVLDPITFHSSWVDPKVDRLVVASEEAYALATKYGMPEEKIKVSGMPIHPRFLMDYGSKSELRRGFDLEPDVFTVLLMGGGGGIGGIYNIVKALNASDLDIQLIVVAGFNKRLELKLIKKHFRFPAKVLGFTDRIPEIMAASDVMITKAGPGAVFEAIAKEIPLIISGNIYGQEEGNVEYVKKNKLGLVAREPEEIISAIRSMQAGGSEEFRANMRRVRNPAAVYEMAKLIAGYLE